MPNHVNRAVIGYQEWRDTLLSIYTCIPGDLSDICHGVWEEKYLQSKLTCKVGGLINIHHDEVVGGLGHHVHLSHLFSRVCSESLSTPHFIYGGGEGASGEGPHQGHQ